MRKRYTKVKGHYRRSKSTYVKPYRNSSGTKVKGHYRKSSSTSVISHKRKLYPKKY